MIDTACQLCQIFLLSGLHFHILQNISLHLKVFLEHYFILQESSVLAECMHLTEHFLFLFCSLRTYFSDLMGSPSPKLPLLQGY